MVAARRPSLVLQTLESFGDHLFRHCEIGTVRVNLDPIFGSERDASDVIDIIKERMPQAEINQPVTPNFTRAVQWIWSGMPDGPFLHLEDDWICLNTIPINKIVNDLDESVKMILLLSATHGKRGLNRESVRTYKKKFFGLTYTRTPLPTFGTSPSITDGAFAREAALRFSLDLDPEKQMRDNLNPHLIEHLNNYRCLFQSSSSNSPLIEDIGRDWQSTNKVTKVVRNGTSSWVIDE